MTVIVFKQSKILESLTDIELRQLLVHFDFQMVTLERNYLLLKVAENLLDKGLRVIKDNDGNLQLIEWKS